MQDFCSSLAKLLFVAAPKNLWQWSLLIFPPNALAGQPHLLVWPAPKVSLFLLLRLKFQGVHTAKMFGSDAKFQVVRGFCIWVNPSKAGTESINHHWLIDLVSTLDMLDWGLARMQNVRILHVMASYAPRPKIIAFWVEIKNYPKDAKHSPT